MGGWEACGGVEGCRRVRWTAGQRAIEGGGIRKNRRASRVFLAWKVSIGADADGLEWPIRLSAGGGLRAPFVGRVPVRRMGRGLSVGGQRVGAGRGSLDIQIALANSSSGGSLGTPKACTA